MSRIDLLQPIPDQTAAFALKDGYRQHPIDFDHPLHDEPLVPVAEYGLPGQSYYSQPNKATRDPVEGVSPDIFVRRTLAEKLAAVSEFLQESPLVESILGGPVRLHVRDGYRAPELQEHLYSNVIPNLLRTLHPDWTDDEINTERSKTIAFPEWSLESPPPHATGGAVDIGLQFIETEQPVFSGYGRVELGKDAIRPDFLEGMSTGDYRAKGMTFDEYFAAGFARRALYNLMTTPEVGGVATTVNPTETWHFSIGDQMWAKLNGEEAAYYSKPIEVPEALIIKQL